MHWTTIDDARTWLANTGLWANMWPQEREDATLRLWRAYKAGAFADENTDPDEVAYDIVMEPWKEG